MIKNITAILFFIGGIILVILAGKIWFERNNQESKLFLNENEIFDLNYFIESSVNLSDDKRINLNEKSIIVLFLTTDDICSPCINEAISYTYYFKKFGFGGNNPQQLVVVVDPDKKRIKRFVKTTEFITPVLYGHDNKYDTFFQSYDLKEDQRQLILFDNNSRRVFFRAHWIRGIM